MSAALDTVGKIICVGGGLLVMAWIVISLCVIAARADRRMEQMEEDKPVEPVELDGYLQEYAKPGPTKMLEDRALREWSGEPVYDVRTGKYVNTSDHVHERRGK